VILKAEKLGEEFTWLDEIDLSHHSGEHRVKLFVKASKQISDELVVVKRGA
jgi:hypothetical protein